MVVWTGSRTLMRHVTPGERGLSRITLHLQVNTAQAMMPDACNPTHTAAVKCLVLWEPWAHKAIPVKMACGSRSPQRATVNGWELVLKASAD